MVTTGLGGTEGVNRCPICKENHMIFKCPSLIGKTPAARLTSIRSLQLCFNCLKADQSVSDCPSNYTCKQCRQKHHTLLHINKSTPTVTTTVVQVNESNEVNVNTSLIFAPKTLTPQVLLATILLEIQDSHGNFHPVRALLGSGSQASLIVTSRVKSLRLARSPSSMRICGLGSSSKSSIGTASVKVRSIHNHDISFDWDMEILDRICNDLPSSPLSEDVLSHISPMELADPHWNRPGAIELLLGADIIPSLMMDGRIEGDTSTPTAMNTVFGWVLVGPIVSRAPLAQVLWLQTSDVLDDNLKSFWEIEEIRSKPHLSLEDQLAEGNFQETFFRDTTGRLGVSLPFRASRPSFQNMMTIADRR